MDSWVDCEWYNFVMQSIVGGRICLVGIICNVIALNMLCFDVVKMLVAYQLKSLAIVDTIQLMLWFLAHAHYYAKSYFHGSPHDLYWRVINPVIYAYISPVYCIAHTSTIWLTVFIGLYRYVAICKPTSDLNYHFIQYGRKYLALVLIMACLINIPQFFVYKLVSYEIHGWVYFDLAFTDYGRSCTYWYGYETHVYPMFVICFPFVVLFVATVRSLVGLRKQKQKRRTMQTCPDNSRENVNTMLISVLVFFTICQFLRFLYTSVVYRYYNPFYECGGFRFYFSHVAVILLVVNSSVNPFIYFFLNKSFRPFLVDRCCCSRSCDKSDDMELQAI